MNKTTGLRFLRPYLYQEVVITRQSAYVRFYCVAAPATNALGYESSIAAPKNKQLRDGEMSKQKKLPRLKEQEKTARIRERIEKLKKHNELEYPRLENTEDVMTVADFNEAFKDLITKSSDVKTVRGRVFSLRHVGRKLIFISMMQDGQRVDVKCEFQHLADTTQILDSDFSRFTSLIRPGDIISVSGTPSLSRNGDPAIVANKLPITISPGLAQLPLEMDDRETRIRNRHLDLLVNRSAADKLRVRSHIIQYMRGYLLKDKFLEVQTPIIADKASGAIARPFATTATEFPDKQLALRIAPEIWLKRLILGGIDRVFEIGPAFRNEGLDATHNPEFTTCEFYKSYASFEDLILMTEELICGMAKHITSMIESKDNAIRAVQLPVIDVALSIAPFKRISFIPAVEAALGESLPDLNAQDAETKLIALLDKNSITVPASPTLPRLLDRLSTLFIEPYCSAPTFITNHPACMAPLSKSFIDPMTNQAVSARAELFIHHKEVANMYEEENSPFEQRRKFEEQTKWKDAENGAHMDESYLRALEYGLPPTGGWGCGVDRLCMLLTGATRISDVLSFGSLRNVVGLGNEAKDRDTEEKPKPKREGGK
ncbi:hypothetical protein BJ878DRAFT_511449 [Calycina marina]|uniref:Aminoacyl-transfer RNA synthetases class-II family profile domain-containing protein n=1 Tax=Calycina marina TaxID=1763456 RepID=A0A9P8CDR1_9HELO|nr:hypothetical protein BJ878DRAFT_511449 [Calycina marina]